MNLWLLLIVIIHGAYSFSNLFITELLGLGYSHGGITGKAIKKVAYEYLDVKTEVEFLEKLKFDLWIQHVTAVDMIEKFNDNVDNDPETKNRPMYHFDAERFVRANNLLMASQALILNLIRTGQYVVARQQLGKYLHTHQDFYSHSNWIEMGENGTYTELGEIDAFHGNVATINMSTCLNCSKPCDDCIYECVDNIIPLINRERIFTSGYYGGEIEDDQPVVKPTNVLKCSHGGVTDGTQDIPALGGINKDVKLSVISPHYYHQETAAGAAIESTYLFLKKLWHLTETKYDNTSHFGRLLELVPYQRSINFVVDLSSSMNENIDDMKMFVREIILSIVSNQTLLPREINIVAFEKQCYSIVTHPDKHGDIDRLLHFLDSLVVMGSHKFTMDAIVKSLSLSDDDCLVYVFTDELSNDSGRTEEVVTLAQRKRCNINFLLLDTNSRSQSGHRKRVTSMHEVVERLVVETSGMNLDIKENNLHSIIKLVMQTLNTRLIPILSINPISSSFKTTYSFHIDNSVEMIQFVIYTSSECHQCMSSDLSNLFILPDRSSANIILNFDSENVKVGQIFRPIVGVWRFQANSSFVKSVEIKLKTSIHFEHSFRVANKNSIHPGLYPVHTEPVVGSQLHNFIRILQYASQMIIFHELEFIDSCGHILEQYKLIKQNDFIYISNSILPFVDFFIKIKGKNNQNELIERIYPYKIRPRAIELNLSVDGIFSSYLPSELKTNVNITIINRYTNATMVDTEIRQTYPIFDILFNQSQIVLNTNEMQTISFQLIPFNNFTMIGKSSELSIIVKNRFQSRVFNRYTFRSTTALPSDNIQSLICNYSFPMNKTPIEMCGGDVDLCFTRHWSVYLNVTDVNPSHLQVGIHSVVLSYYDNKNIAQAKHKTVRYFNDGVNRTNLQLLLSSNDCCGKYFDIVAYDQHGHKVQCIKLQSISVS